MEKPKPTRRLLNLLLVDKTEITSIYFYAILGGLLNLSVPVGVQAIIGFVMGASMVTSIYVLIFLVVIGVAAVGLMEINKMKIIEKIQQNIFTRNAFEFAEKTPQFDLLKADNFYLPEKANRFFDTINVQKGLSKLLLDVPTATIQIVFGLLLLTFYHPLFIVFGLVLVTILWVILRLTSPHGLATSLEESNYKYAVVAWLEEMARVIKSFKFSQGSNLNLYKMDKNVVGYLNARTQHFKVLLFQFRTLVIFKVAITTSMLTVGTFLLLDQQLNIGEFIAAEIVILTVINAVEKLISSLDGIYDVITGLEKLASVTESDLDKDGTIILNSEKNGIALKIHDLSFGYSSDKKILNNINLDIEPNSISCIIGNEDSGKSTLLKVLSGNIGGYTGSILINNLSLTNYTLLSVRSQTGLYLNQNDLFLGTIWENISMGKKAVTIEKVIDLAEKLGFQHLLNNLSEGFETMVDPAGKKMSASTRKQILLLRALAHSPKYILLKEPWAGLETIEKEKIQHYLIHELTDATIIISTKDKEFANKCDYKIELIDGTASLSKNIK